jgi:uncharacterized OB-fold protein
MIVCTSLRDKIAFRFIRFGFRIALKHKTENKYLKYQFKNEEYIFATEGYSSFERLFKVKCDNCGKGFIFEPNYNYCPYCGAADMRKKEGAE